jgi:hypothetical protein
MANLNRIISSLGEEQFNTVQEKIQAMFELLSQCTTVARDTTLLTSFQNNDLEVALNALLSLNNTIPGTLSRLEDISLNNKEMGVQFGNATIQSLQRMDALCENLSGYAAEQLRITQELSKSMMILADGMKNLSQRVDKIERAQLGGKKGEAL